jgi:hypothetical protein
MISQRVHEEVPPQRVLDLLPPERVILRKRRNIQITLGHKKVLVLAFGEED